MVAEKQLIRRVVDEIRMRQATRKLRRREYKPNALIRPNRQPSPLEDIDLLLELLESRIGKSKTFKKGKS